MAQNPSGLDMVREIIGQINNLRKLITVNGKTYKYDQKSKSYKADGKSFTPSQLKAKLEGQSYKAPKIDNKSKLKVKPKLKRTGKLYPGGISRPDKGRYGRNLPSKDKYGVPSQKKRLLKPKASPKTSVKTKVSQAANKVKNVGKNLKIKNLVKGGLRNAKTLGAGLGATWAADQVVDRSARQLAGKSKMTLKEFRAERDKKLKEREESLLSPLIPQTRTNKRPTGAERNKIVASKKRVTTRDDYEHGRRQTRKGKTKYWNKNTNSWQTNKPGPFIKKSPYKSTAAKSTTPTRAEKLKKGMRTWRTDSEEQKKLNKGETNNEVKIKSTKRKANAKPRKSSVIKAKAKAKPIKSTTAEDEAREKWIKDTRNSPAQRSGAFDPKKLYELHKHHQGFKKARKEGTLKEWRKKNKRR